MSKDNSDIFGPQGALAGALKNYEERPQQRTMADQVGAAFSDDESLVIEAATGTGKTLAYLIPAIRSGKTTIVSTATKNLQDQIIEKDIPLLKQVLPQSFSAVSLKGRQNYLCLWQLENFKRDKSFRYPADANYWPRISSWAETTETGDRAELHSLPDNYATWSELSIGAESCMGSDCEYYDECFVMKARDRAAAANVVVVNHHLFFADLSLRTNYNVSLLPEGEALVFDEAHHLEETAAAFFGMQVSNYRFSQISSDTKSFLKREEALDDETIEKLREIEQTADVFFDLFRNIIKEENERLPLEEVLEDASEADIESAKKDAIEALGGLRDHLKLNAKAGEIGTRLAARCETIAADLSFIMKRNEAERVYLVERRGKGIFLQAFPIDLRPTLRSLVHSRNIPRIYTSATLTTDGDFRFFKQRLGLADSVESTVLEPVFDYMDQSVLYVPPQMPNPNDPSFIEAAVREIEKLLKITEGRAFLLFTSYRNMRGAWHQLQDKIPYSTLLQGTASKNSLLENFREDEHSVLFATASFWEGVDVPGDSLSLVVIDKLPFASPGDPVTAARLALLEEQGYNPFSSYTVPQAAIGLKQGYGRLIRHRNDHGIIAILDTRILSRGYGKRFLRTLPRSRRTQDLDVVKRWWKMKASSE
jgi:ATP-dependent DNA helicase DinG